jgi:hypothetical protein
MSILTDAGRISIQTVEVDGVPIAGPQVIVQLDQATADRLAAHYAARVAAGSDPLAAESREIAAPVMAALVAAGYGGQ